MVDFDQIVAALRPLVGEALIQSGAAVAVESGSGQGCETDDAHTEQTDVTPTGGWEAFGQRLQAAVANCHRRPQLNDISSRWITTTAALAASLLLAWGTFRLGRQEAPGRLAQPVTPGQPLAATVASLDRGYIEEKAHLFAIMQQYCGGQLTSLQVSNSNTQNDAGAPLGGPVRDVLIVRLNLGRGNDTVSQDDVMIVPGTKTSIDVATRDGPPLHYEIETSATDPTQLRIRVELPNRDSSGKAGAIAAMLGTHIRVKPFADVAAGRLVTPTGAYDLTVSAAPVTLPERKL
jgi:hypothetical protein